MRYELLTGLECRVDRLDCVIRSDPIEIGVGEEVDKCQRTDWTTQRSKPGPNKGPPKDIRNCIVFTLVSIALREVTRERERERDGTMPGQRPVVASISKSYGTLSFKFINQKQKQPKQNLAQSSCVSLENTKSIDRWGSRENGWVRGGYRTGSFVDLCRSSFCFWGLLFMFFFTLHR